MRRRQFLGTLGGAGAAALGWYPEEAYPGADTKRLGVLDPSEERPAREWWAATFRELGSLGFAEGRNLTVDFRAANGDPSELLRLASRLVRSGMDVILTKGTQATRALQRESTSLPIVTGVGDPVGSGFAQSLGKPGGNITGVSWGSHADAAKRVETARALLPDMSRLKLLVAAGNRAAWDIVAPYEPAWRQAGITPTVELVTSSRHLRELIQATGGRTVGAVWMEDEVGIPWEDTPAIASISELAVRANVALFAREPRWARNGGLAGLRLTHRKLDKTFGTLIAKILRGARPAELPFVMPDTTELGLNLKTASALGLKVPEHLMLAATEVIR